MPESHHHVQQRVNSCNIALNTFVSAIAREIRCCAAPGMVIMGTEVTALFACEAATIRGSYIPYTLLQGPRDAVEGKLLPPDTKKPGMAPPMLPLHRSQLLPIYDSNGAQAPRQRTALVFTHVLVCEECCECM